MIGKISLSQIDLTTEDIDYFSKNFTQKGSNNGNEQKGKEKVPKNQKTDTRIGYEKIWRDKNI
ncbi:hypothetical protein HZS_3758 [Henneguya salminicola]|nr:hypothetical protein HZS_3758 [Henneguya salminicola]